MPTGKRGSAVPRECRGEQGTSGTTRLRHRKALEPSPKLCGSPAPGQPRRREGTSPAAPSPALAAALPSQPLRPRLPELFRAVSAVSAPSDRSCCPSAPLKLLLTQEFLSPEYLGTSLSRLPPSSQHPRALRGDPGARGDTKPVLGAQMLAAQHLLPVPILGPKPRFSTFLQLPISFPICLLKSLQIPSAQCRGRTTDSSAEPSYTSSWGHRNHL